MKKWLSIVLAALLIFCAAAVAETGNQGDISEFDFTGDGYDGSWTEVKALSLEFCLPMNWSETQAQGEAAFAAVNGAGTVTLSIRPVADGVKNVAAWGAENLKKGEADEANFYDVLVVEEAKSLSVYLVVSDEQLVAFDFTRPDENALPRQFALQIVGSACALWDDDIVPDMEGDGGDFDFGEAFESELG